MAKKKTTKKAFGYAIFDSDVKASDKYMVTSKPKVYQTKAAALAALRELVKSGHLRSALKVLRYDIAREKKGSGLHGSIKAKPKRWGSKEERFSKFSRELSILSSKYGIAVDVIGGVYILDHPTKITYDNDHTSGDLQSSWEED